MTVSNQISAFRPVRSSVFGSTVLWISGAQSDQSAVDALLAGTPAFETDTQALRRVFDALAERVDEDEGTEATTILDADTVPLAWAGRPSDIPVDRVRRATEDWFALEWALGLRVVHVHPLTGRPGRVLVTERSLGSAGAPTL